MSVHSGPRGYADGTSTRPYGSPMQAQAMGAPSGTYYFKFGAMSSAQQLEYQSDYYEGKPFCCLFRSPYAGVATTNKIGLSIPMRGILVQRDTLDLRASVYFNTQTVYNNGDYAGDSGYAYRKIMLGRSGGHGIYNNTQSNCSWSDSVGSVGAGYNGTCGTFPDGLIWGTGQSSSANYTNLSGTWSHWVYWNGANYV